MIFVLKQNIEKILEKIPKNSLNHYDWKSSPCEIAELVKLWFDVEISIPKFVKYKYIEYNVFRGFTLGRIKVRNHLYDEYRIWDNLCMEICKLFKLNNFDEFLKLREIKIKSRIKKSKS